MPLTPVVRSLRCGINSGVREVVSNSRVVKGPQHLVVYVTCCSVSAFSFTSSGCRVVDSANVVTQTHRMCHPLVAVVIQAASGGNSAKSPATLVSEERSVAEDSRIWSYGAAAELHVRDTRRRALRMVVFAGALGSTSLRPGGFLWCRSNTVSAGRVTHA